MPRYRFVNRDGEPLTGWQPMPAGGIRQHLGNPISIEVQIDEGLLSDEKVTEWQPIETAPKDRRIRLWRPGNVSDNSSEQHGKWNVDKYSRKPRPYWDYEGFRITDSRERPPTHWMDVGDAPDITF